ncbi:MAG: hypothetical protein ACI9QD_001084 [Thermoproteota archaeon]|jgi:hypothetical protein
MKKITTTAAMLLSLLNTSTTYAQEIIEMKNTPAGLIHQISDMQPVESLNLDKERNPHKKAIPSKTWRSYDPIEKNWYSDTIVGKTYKSSNPFASYDYWRYITVYDKEGASEQLAYLPWYEEACWEESFRMAAWQETKTFKVSLTTQVGAEGLGLSASVEMSIEQGVSFSTTRNVMATKGIAARHYPFKYAEEWEGVTWIQTYNKSTKTYGYLKKSMFEDTFGGYPYDFYLDNQNMGFQIKRDVTKKCDGYSQSSDNTLEMGMYL